MRKWWGLIPLTFLLAVGVFLLTGLFVPSVSYQSGVEINKPRDFVWRQFTDESKTKEWMPGFKRFETISGKPLEVGSKFKLVIESEGQEYELTETNTEIRAPELFGFNLENEVLKNEVTVTFTEQNGKTLLTQDEKVTGSNIFWRAMFFWMKSSLNENSKFALNRLKVFVESQN
jgi:uncharacterized protein YndB with AHSA1/START domain